MAKCVFTDGKIYKSKLDNFYKNAKNSNFISHSQSELKKACVGPDAGRNI